jgi:hypothetical protein
VVMAAGFAKYMIAAPTNCARHSPAPDNDGFRNSSEKPKGSERKSPK